MSATASKKLSFETSRLQGENDSGIDSKNFENDSGIDSKNFENDSGIDSKKILVAPTPPSFTIPDDPKKITREQFGQLPEPVRAALGIKQKQVDSWNDQADLLAMIQAGGLKNFQAAAIVAAQFNKTGSCWNKKRIQDTLTALKKDGHLKIDSKRAYSLVARGQKEGKPS